MIFLYPEWFHAFPVIAAAAVLFLLSGKRKSRLLDAFAGRDLRKELAESHASGKERFKKTLLICVLVLLVVTLAQPQWGEEKKEVRRKGVEMMFLVDTSLSMLAEDAPPSRIEKAKLLMKSFLKKFRGDRVGIITFAGSGFVQSPLTLDYDAFVLFANSIQVGYIPDAGTSLSEALRTAVKSFPDTKRKQKVFILLSDGEHHEGNLEPAIREAAEAGARLYAVGIGTPEGAPIPLRDEHGKMSGYKKDRSGQVVLTKLNSDLLARIASQTGGLYVPATPSEREVDWIYDHLQNLEKKEFQQRIVVERENHFQFFLGLALALLAIEMLVGETKRGSFKTAQKQTA